MDMNFLNLAAMICAAVYCGYVFEFTFSDQKREWWEPFLMPLIMPFCWLRNGGWAELVGWCVPIVFVGFAVCALWLIVEVINWIVI